MINIIIKNINKKIQQLNISGHANAGKFNQDLVCAAVTGIVSGALNALDTNFEKDVKLQVLENEIIIENLNLNNHDLQVMLEMLRVQLFTIWTQYKKNIQMKEVH
ncbi:hypothetical protein EELLY_v1c01180 [Entomoplasma ellychniae]|uniref:Ribosomal processing cysteine protease Prp n=2 Tax=Entomoplasmataceae TaxID=33925 RepID=A0A2S5RFV9_9MOLU|nr:MULTISPECIES: ribosomal-processing cysteine protease Prp [Entomoplasmataceae]PPE04443.1 hypothetical protein EELLY_v1c01180 [Entomoplasma ellychniae]PPE06214.1 hypothetical protein MCORR_v1c05180 [Mesoplasma corruscae]